MNRFLLKPEVTLAAIASTVCSVALAGATVTQPLQDLFGPHVARNIGDVCLIIAAVSGAIAGIGRSPVPSVDNPPKP